MFTLTGRGGEIYKVCTDGNPEGHLGLLSIIAPYLFCPTDSDLWIEDNAPFSRLLTTLHAYFSLSEKYHQVLMLIGLHGGLGPVLSPCPLWKLTIRNSDAFPYYLSLITLYLSSAF